MVGDLISELRFIQKEGQGQQLLLPSCPSSVHLAPVGTITFSSSCYGHFSVTVLLIMVSAPKTATWSSLCTACTQTETETEHLRWDLSYLLGLPMSSLCPHRPGHIWAPWSAGEGSSSWLVSRGSEFSLCMKRSSVIKKFSAHPKIKTMLLCSPPLPLQAHVSFAFLTTSAHWADVFNDLFMMMQPVYHSFAWK